MRSLRILAATLPFGLLLGCSASLVRVEEKFTLTAAWQNYDRVIVRTVNGRVELKSAPNLSDATISGTKRAGGITLDDANKNLEQLKITVAPDARDPRALLVALEYPEGLRNRSIGANFVIHTPQPCAADVQTGNGTIVAESLRGEVRLHTSNGDVHAAAIDGTLKIATSNGDIEAREINGGVDADTSNGGVRLTKVGGGCAVKSSNGELVLTGVVGAARARSSNGSITFEGAPSGEDAVELETSNGEIVLRVAATLKGHLRLDTSNGGIHTTFGSMALSNPKISKRRLEADMNGGGGVRLVARTSNGAIKLTCQ